MDAAPLRPVGLDVAGDTVRLTVEATDYRDLPRALALVLDGGRTYHLVAIRKITERCELTFREATTDAHPAHRQRHS